MTVKGNKKKQMDSLHVRATRAGDLFHYRWAATRVLNLLKPDSSLKSISIEGGHIQIPNDYIIDLEECFENKRVVYQLKYSVMHPDKECSLSFLGDTLSEYGNLYKTSKKEKISIEYVFLTNRPVSAAVKNLFETVHEDSSSLDKINKYLKLPCASARQFCQQFRIIDLVESTDQQLHNVECQLMALVSSRINSDEARAFVEFVAEKAASQRNVLTKENVLSYLGCSCQDDLFPARACYDVAFKAINTLGFAKAHSLTSESQQRKVVVHAAGGVGKSAFLRWMHMGLTCNSILYDCYGGGMYRNSNGLRHRIRDAFVEIANELYAKGLCRPLLKWQSTSDDAICDMFWQRISEAVAALRRQAPGQYLYLLVDAADNANIAAHENGNATSFVDHLIKAGVPEGCRIVFTARSERLDFVKARNDVLKVKLSGFTTDEVFSLISSKILNGVDKNLASAVRSFTRGNPRVILNLLSFAKTANELKLAISPNMPNTVSNIVEKKIQDYICGLSKNYDQSELARINLLFDALAILPPTIPIGILAGVSGVEQELVESFITEFGASFWFENDMVHFRDEPTEMYFRDTYGKSEDCKRRVLAALEKLGRHSGYAALAIPRLLFALGDYARLFELARTKEGIPESNKTEARHLWLLRLEYAYRAALKLKYFKDAIPLAFLLAAEDNGNVRQRSLVLDHLPFLAQIISEEEVDSLCRDKDLAWGWKGSHNLVVAVLKSVRNGMSPVAQSYLRPTIDWMWVSFDEYNRHLKKKRNRQDVDALDDICMPSESQIAFVALVIYRLRGLAQCANYIGTWGPAASRFKIASAFASSLLAIGESIDVLLSLSNTMVSDPAVNLALNLILSGYGKSVGTKAVESMIAFLKSSKPFSGGFQMPRKDDFVQAILSACESAARIISLRGDASEVIKVRILRNIPYYGGGAFEERNFLFLRAYALWLVLKNKSYADCDFEQFKDKNFIEKDAHEKRIAVLEVEKRIGFYIAVEEFLVENTELNLNNVLESYGKLTSSYELRDWERWEIDADCVEVKVRAKCLGIQHEALEDASCWLAQKIRIGQKINVARYLMTFGYRKESIKYLNNAYSDMFCTKGEYQVEGIADWLMCMSEIAAGTNDALSKRFYDKSFDILSNVDDETLQHFDALKALMRRAGEKKVKEDLVVRFLRCAEHAYKYDSKHFDSSGAFNVFARNNITGVLAALSRFRDRGFYHFGYVFCGLLEALVRYHGFSCNEVWSMRFLLNNHEQLYLLEFVLSESKNRDLQQAYFNDFVDMLSRRVERVEDQWATLSSLAKRFLLNDKVIRPYVRLLRSGSQQQTWQNYASKQKSNRRFLTKIIQSIDYSTNTWLVDYYKSARNIYDSQVVKRTLLDNLPADKYSDLLAQMATPGGLSVWDVSALLEAFPREKHGIASDNKWNSAIEKIVKRFAKEGEIPYLHCLVDSMPDTEVKRAILGDSLSEASETVGVNSHMCYTIVGLACLMIEPDEAENIAITHIESFEKELDGTLGDSIDKLGDIEIDSPHDALAGLLWGALGSPVSWYRWNATYCISALIESGCNSIIESICNYHGKFESRYYMANDAAFYDGFAEMFFAIAVNHAAAKQPRSIANMIQWITEKYICCENAVIKWYYYEALKKSNVACGIPTKEVLEDVSQGIRSSTPPIIVNSWGDCLQYDWDSSVFEGAHGIAEYDVEKYWIPSLARVFGIEERAFLSLFDHAFRRVAERYDNWPSRMRYNYDKRDYRNECCSHSHGSYPRAFAFSTYVSFIALTELAYTLLKHFPVVTYTQEHNDNWWDWLKEHLLERTDGLWLSDESDPVPIDFVSDNSYVKELDEGDLPKCISEKIFALASPIKNSLPIGGNWATSVISKRLSVKFYCVLVPRKEGIAYVKKLRSCEREYGYPVPYLYSDCEKPPFVCKGKWRGMLHSWQANDWSHFEHNDPNYGGFDRHQIMIDNEVQRLLNAQRNDLGNILYCGKKEIARLVRWGTGEEWWSRRSVPKHVGSVLWLSKQAIVDIEDRLQCDVIIGARVERSDAYRDYAYVKPECVYIWELARNV